MASRHSSLKSVFVVTGVICALASSAFARTWYVRVDGTGDAPSIAAAMDSSVSGDTVLVAAGTYEIDGFITVTEGITLLSENGPYETKLVPQPFMYPLGALSCSGFREETVIEGFWIDGFIWSNGGLGTLFIDNCWYLRIQNNIFTNNRDAGVAVGGTSLSVLYIYNNTFVDNSPYAINGNGEQGFMTGNIIWGRADAIDMFYIIECNCMMETADASGAEDFNFEMDPQFCGGPGSGNYFIQSDSPCAPGNAPPPLDEICGLRLIGALPVGCGTVPVEHTTWGRIKSMYR
jgi:hypothetical protein